MKFNVHHWNESEWIYLATVRAKNETEAASIAAFRFGLKGRYACYPHIDCMDQWTPANSLIEVH